MSSFQIRRVRDHAKPHRLRRLITVGLPLLRIVNVLREHLHTLRDHSTVQQTRRRRLQRITLALFAALVALLLLMGALKVVVRMKELALGFVTVAAADLPADDAGYTNVLLLGKGDDDHDGVDLTDTVMVASLDPGRTRSVVLLSIPRDTYLLQTASMGKGRINSLYRDTKIRFLREGLSHEEAARQALTLLGQEVGTILGMQIHGVVLVNFSGFVQAVDLLGGIDLDVPEAIVDPEYPGPNYTYQTFRIDAGRQHLDGAVALQYARSRHTTSDFSRSARQQQVLSALAVSVQEQGIIRNLSMANELLGIIADNLETTFSSRELLGLVALGRSLDPRLVLSLQLSDRNGLYGSLAEPGGLLYTPPREEFDGASVLLPVSIPELPVTWRQVQTFASVLLEQRALLLRPASVTVRNAGAPAGVARSLSEELTRYAFRVADVRNYGRRGTDDQATSFIVVRASRDDDAAAQARQKIAAATADFLSTTLGIPVRTLDDERAFADSDAEIAIVLGAEYRYTPLQELLQPA